MTNIVLRRVMLVDDDRDINTVMQLALATVGGWDLEICHSGQEAIDKASSFQPHLILLDVMMPDMSGPDTLRALRNIPALRNTPVIFVSGKKQADLLEGVEDIGVCGVLKKPFNPLTLKDSILRLWEQHQVRGSRQ